MSLPHSDSSESSLYRSGVERLLATTSRTRMPSWSEANQFEQNAIATEFSWERLRGLKHLRVWELLAIHWYLDPAFLALFTHGHHRLRYVKNVASHLEPGAHLRSFVDAIPVVCSDVTQGKLRCMGNAVEALQRFTTPAWFMDYIRERELWSEPRRGVTMTCVPEDFLPRQLQIGFEAIRILYVPASQGTGSQPGSWPQHKDVKLFLRNHGMSEWLAQGVARAIRPQHAPRGRPRSVTSK